MGAAPSNFDQELTKPDSDLAQQIAKDQYVFDYLNHTKGATARDLEQALIRAGSPLATATYTYDTLPGGENALPPAGSFSTRSTTLNLTTPKRD